MEQQIIHDIIAESSIVVDTARLKKTEMRAFAHAIIDIDTVFVEMICRRKPDIEKIHMSGLLTKDLQFAAPSIGSPLSPSSILLNTPLSNRYPSVSGPNVSMLSCSL